MELEHVRFLFLRLARRKGVSPAQELQIRQSRNFRELRTLAAGLGLSRELSSATKRV